MISDSMALATGMPTGLPAKKAATRRGGRTNRGDLKLHHANAGKAIAAGNHKAVQDHLFKAIKANRQQMMAAPTAATDSDADDQVTGVTAGYSPAAKAGPPPNADAPAAQPLNAPSSMARLAGLLKGRKASS